MPWLQRWLGELYSSLHSEFERNAFTFDEALKVSGLPEPRLSVAFSRLHKSGVLLVFRRSRPRLYRLLDPRNFLLPMPQTDQGDRVRQEQYVQLVCDVFRALRRKLPLVSFAVYGSVARGEAAPSSDLDILIISESFQQSLASRIDHLAWVDEEVRPELTFLRSHGYRPFISFYPLRKEEAQRLPVLFLDLVEDALIVHDEAGFLVKTLSNLKAKLQLMGAKRVRWSKGWYWDLKPDYSFGEVVEV